MKKKHFYNVERGAIFDDLNLDLASSRIPHLCTISQREKRRRLLKKFSLRSCKAFWFDSFVHIA